MSAQISTKEKLYTLFRETKLYLFKLQQNFGAAKHNKDFGPRIIKEIDGTKKKKIPGQCTSLNRITA